MEKDPVISIIDDDVSVRVALASLVRSLGYVAWTFESAEAFLAAADVSAVSCIVTDIQMPGMSGLELNCRVKQAGYEVPTVFITAFPEEYIRARAEAGGAYGFLAKPFDGQALVGLINSAVKH